MKTKEIENRELDEWLIKNGACPEFMPGGFRSRPTTDPAAALEVLRKCGTHAIRGTSFVCCQFSHGSYSTLCENGHWTVGRLDRDGCWVSGESANAETLELAICKFARMIFTK